MRLCGVALIGSLALSMLPTAVSRARAQDPSNVQCLSEVEIPRFSALAAGARKFGTVTARMTVGKGGVPANVDAEGPDQRLIEEVRVYVTESARFLSECEGQQVILKFTFQLEGEPRDYPFAITRFRPPNHFVIISQPGTPHIGIHPLGAPPKPGRKGPDQPPKK